MSSSNFLPFRLLVMYFTSASPEHAKEAARKGHRQAFETAMALNYIKLNQAAPSPLKNSCFSSAPAVA